MKMIDVTEKTWTLNAISTLQDVFLFFARKGGYKNLAPGQDSGYRFPNQLDPRGELVF